MKTMHARFSVTVLIVSCVLAACDPRLPKTEASSNIAIADAAAEASQAVTVATDKTSHAFDEATTTEKAKWVLAGVMNMKSMEIFVETVEGRVTLSGNVSSEAESQRAASVVSGLEGVKQVENRLVVKSRI